MKATKWYTLLTLALALLLFSGTTGVTHTQASSSGSPLAAPAVCNPSWSVVSSPNPGTGNNSLSSVAALSTNDIWAVGYYSSTGVYNTLTEHWDGSSWSVVSSANPGNIFNYLRGVTAISSSDVWAVGSYVVSGGPEQTLTEHWDGSSWSVVSSPAPGTLSLLTSVTAISSSDVWAAGYSRNGIVYQTLIEH